MRSGMMVALLLTSGALAVAEDDKKAPDKPDPKLPERITYRQWNEKDKRFAAPVENWPASYYEPKDGSAWRIKGASLVGGAPTKGSEITDKDGTVWVVEKVSVGSDFHVCYVTKKKP